MDKLYDVWSSEECAVGNWDQYQCFVFLSVLWHCWLGGRTTPGS